MSKIDFKKIRNEEEKPHHVWKRLKKLNEDRLMESLKKAEREEEQQTKEIE